jgi:hypothetical protein
MLLCAAANRTRYRPMKVRSVELEHSPAIAGNCEVGFRRPTIKRALRVTPAGSTKNQSNIFTVNGLGRVVNWPRA